MRRSSVPTLLSILVLGACHSFAPTTADQMESSERVRLRFSSPRTVLFGTGAGAASASNVASIEGVIVQMPQDSIRMRVAGASDEAGGAIPVPPNALTTIARRDLVAADRREISRGRTAITVGVAAIAFVAALALAFSGN
jgi:hypothetical protein